MSERLDEHQPTPEDALARTVAARRGEASVWVTALRELGAIDRAVYQAVADTPSPTLDGPGAACPPRRTTRACGSGWPVPSPSWAADGDAGPQSRPWWRSGPPPPPSIWASSRSPGDGAPTGHRPTTPGSCPCRNPRPSRPATLRRRFAFGYAVGRTCPGSRCRCAVGGRSRLLPGAHRCAHTRVMSPSARSSAREPPPWWPPRRRTGSRVAVPDRSEVDRLSARVRGGHGKGPARAAATGPVDQVERRPDQARFRSRGSGGCGAGAVCRDGGLEFTGSVLDLAQVGRLRGVPGSRPR